MSWPCGDSYESVSVIADDGEDRVTLQDVEVVDDLYATMGDGNEELYLYGNTVGGGKHFNGGSG